jgi:hypothetical protein
MKRNRYRKKKLKLMAAVGFRHLTIASNLNHNLVRVMGSLVRIEEALRRGK